MQIDWAVILRGSNRLSAFVATLGRSRASHVVFVTDERIETLVEAPGSWKKSRRVVAKVE